MNQIKIGKFISECRKKENLTQLELAKKLNVTDRAISKWENGRGMPDASLMISLCDVLKISVNDLLCGEIVSQDNDLNQEVLLEIIKEKQYIDKPKIRGESGAVSDRKTKFCLK
jgi:transcriptional regulator with XRE-family HTH domain